MDSETFNNIWLPVSKCSVFFFVFLMERDWDIVPRLRDPASQGPGRGGCLDPLPKLPSCLVRGEGSSPGLLIQFLSLGGGMESGVGYCLMLLFP